MTFRIHANAPRLILPARPDPDELERERRDEDREERSDERDREQEHLERESRKW
jgi:hypothetical protein